MTNLIARARQFFTWLWSVLGDPKTKNALLVILLVMTGFGMVAPDVATSMRDTIIALAF
jgi:hypothetical protein